MERKFIPRNLILTGLIAMIQLSGYSQDIITSEEFNPDNNSELGRLTSVYREYFKKNEYDLARESWTVLFNEYPEVSERLYTDGVTMYRHFIEEAPEDKSRESKIDTLMLIYDQRIEYFGGEGNVLGRKGNDLLMYRSSDSEQAQAAYGMLRRSLEIEGAKSRAPIMLNYISSGLLLYNAELISNIQVMEDYFLVNGLLDQVGSSNSRWEKTRASIDEMILKEDILSCVGLDLFFGSRFEQSSDDQGLLRKMISYYENVDCNQSDLYAAASEKLFEIDPDPESAHSLAMLFVGREDLEKASYYLQMAVLGENLPDETRAEWFYKLSVISLANGDQCGSIEFARQANAYKKDYGKAYMALGDAYIASRHQLADEFQQQCVYWAAADMYQAAARTDPSLAEESREKMNLCTFNFPNKEDIFFQDLTIGSSYRIGGCIQENTTIRSSD